MTTGVAMFGIAATAGIGAVAASDHPGKVAAAAGVADDGSIDDGGAPALGAGPDALAV